MATINVTELNHGITHISGSNLTIELNADSVVLKSHGVLINSAKIRELGDNEIIAYVNAWFDCVAIVPIDNGTTADIEPVLNIGCIIRELDSKVFDVKNCIGCGAYSKACGLDMLMAYYTHLNRETAEKLLS